MEEAFVIVIITGTAILFLLACFIFAFMWLYQKRNFEHSRETDRMKELYTQEILKAELEVKEKTLNMVSLEIHDNIGQVLSVAKLNLKTITSTTADGHTHRLEEVSELISRAIQDLRSLTKTMNNDYITVKSLSELLRNEVNHIGLIGAFQIELFVNGVEVNINSQKQIIIYRLIQECLSNIIKHARCSNVRIVLDFRPSEVTVTVQDNGRGFDVTVASSGLGISNMRNRARLIGGDLSIESIKGVGTKMSLTLPSINL
jgi:two-component system NarL family sensor kinase